MKPLFIFSILIIYIPKTSSNNTCGNRPFNTEARASELNPIDGKWPWLVSIQKEIEFGYKHICAGTILNNKWIITAAHCFKFWKEDDPKTSLRVLLGTIYLSETGLGAQIRGVKQLIKHEEYDPTNENNDIALLQMDKPVEFSDHIQQACFPKESADLTNMIDCSLAGWGAQGRQSDEPSQLLLEAQVERIDMKRCKLTYKGSIRENHVCAGHRKGPDGICYGDRGSPLMCRTKKNNAYSVIGILSWGSSCGKTRDPGVYSSFQSHIKWIIEKVKNEAVKDTIHVKTFVSKLFFPLVNPDHYMNPSRKMVQNSEFKQNEISTAPPTDLLPDARSTRATTEHNEEGTSQSEAEIKQTENTGQENTPIAPDLNSEYETAENLSGKKVLKKTHGCCSEAL